MHFSECIQLFVPHLMLEYRARDPTPNPIIVFDYLPPDFPPDDAPIMLSARQPSFTCLGITPTPKGFHSLSDFQASERRAWLGRLHCLMPRPAASEQDVMGWRHRRPSQPAGARTGTDEHGLSD
jgi:hypothetical protein